MLNKGKITDEQIQALKKAHPDDGLFKYPFANKKDEFVFKAISHSLYKRVATMAMEAEMQGRPLPIEDANEMIFDSCVVWPELTLEEKLKLPVGAIASCVKIIQEKSGFIDIDIYQRVLGPDTFTTTLKDHEYWGDIDEVQIEALKKEVSPFSIHRVRIGRWVFVIRPMTRVDIQVASQSNDDQLTIARAVTMWPKEVRWDTIPAGIIDKLNRKANDISGWEIADSAEVEEL